MIQWSSIVSPKILHAHTASIRCRSGLSLSPEDSWLPIASVLACILHVQVLLITTTSEGIFVHNSSRIMQCHSLFFNTDRAQSYIRRDSCFSFTEIDTAEPYIDAIALTLQDSKETFHQLLKVGYRLSCSNVIVDVAESTWSSVSSVSASPV